mgnify:CR=1 FL=1
MTEEKNMRMERINRLLDLCLKHGEVRFIMWPRIVSTAMLLWQLQMEHEKGPK